MSKQECVEKILFSLRFATQLMPKPMVSLLINEYGRDPFLILIACLLSLRARDKITYPIVKQLFAQAKNPEKMLLIPLLDLEKIIRPIGFYRRKAVTIHTVSKEIIERFNSKVPNSEEELLSLYGVGHKTANLVL